ncbi:MAG TPA: DUF3810 domain-containing protein [Blastocatellia bacterium]|nr:DUF3810 domain-containing protein [Blastocatellia bacterium]
MEAKVSRLGYLKERLSARLFIKISTIALALLLLFVPLPAGFVEQFYSTGIYPFFQSALTPLTNLAPFAIVDLLLIVSAVGLPTWWITRIVKAGRGRRARATGRLLFNTIVLLAGLFLVFEVLWGFNYMRKPLAAKLEYDEKRLTQDSLKHLARATVAGLNRESSFVHSEEWPGEEEWYARLHESFEAAVKEMGNSGGIAPAEPKQSLLNPYLAAAGIEGFVNPFGHEVVLDSDLLAFEKPFTLAHEWAHLAGFADESEASFVGLVACLRSDMPAVRYSGWLALFEHLPRRALDTKSEMYQDNEPLESLRLAPEVIADLRAIGDRAGRNIDENISRMQAKVYDRFLKANRVQAGIGSYGLLVKLVLGTRFDPEWVPVRR